LATGRRAVNAPVLVTGGCGFIGANFILDRLEHSDTPILNLDTLTYAGNPENLASLKNDARYRFIQGDIRDAALVRDLLREYRPAAIIHFAAESHVDRSIRTPEEFISTNVTGTFTLLEAARDHWQGLKSDMAGRFRFLHVSTDEVYGSLGPNDPAFTETTPYAPNSPYAASKAASDHLVRSYHHTYGLPTLTTNCSNNYGPLQFPEKLIPLMIHNALAGLPLPIYGDGTNVRDWLFVRDHCDAVRTVLAKGKSGETYNIGGRNEVTNLEVVKTICKLIDEVRPDGAPHDKLIKFVSDRPGHDRRYAMNIAKIQNELGWTPREDFASGLRKTVAWYLENRAWVEHVTSGAYRQWVETHYARP
jgi:dTDP-glucose 4,6-dehydratase